MLVIYMYYVLHNIAPRLKTKYTVGYQLVGTLDNPSILPYNSQFQRFSYRSLFLILNIQEPIEYS